jgi:hypothetical protein
VKRERVSKVKKSGEKKRKKRKCVKKRKNEKEKRSVSGKIVGLKKRVKWGKKR